MIEKVSVSFSDWFRNAFEACGEPCFALVEGYPYSGFAKVTPDLVLPSASWITRRDDGSIDWTRMWDIRLFGPKGEWHAFHMPGEDWFYRPYRHPDRADTAKEYCIYRRYALWGTHVDSETHPGWWLRSETRGFEVWSPIPAHPDNQRLKVKLIIGSQSETTGLAGIVDAVICGFEETSEEEFND